MRRSELEELSTFVLLLAIALVGRWAQPFWNFTPLAAVAMFSGYYFRRPAVAILLAAAALVTSNAHLPPYNNLPIYAAVMMMLVSSVALGRLARKINHSQKFAIVTICSVVPATAFFIVTNGFVWAFTSLYDFSAPGLIKCYVAGLPFYRNMLLGDVFYVTLFTCCMCLAHFSGFVSPAESNNAKS
jgi:hypothetical protein